MSFFDVNTVNSTLDEKRESIIAPDRFSVLNGLNPERLAAAKKQALARLDKGLEYFEDQFPGPSSVNGTYPKIGNTEWTNGFWTGQLWLAYELSGDQRYLDSAQKQVSSFAERINNRINVDHHDLGFLYSLSCVAAYKITNNKEAYAAALLAADCLLERYLPAAGIIQAWGNLNDPEEAGRMIIDCNLNLPLLYWASEETADDKYRLAADSHIQKAMQYLIRQDASTFHTFFLDIQTGAPRRGTTHQGFSNDSCWARGQAWGIAGFPLVYRHSENPQLINQTCRLANYFLNRLPADLVCYWDLIFTEGSEPRDSSATATSICGLLELLHYLPLTDPDRDTYKMAAQAMMTSLINQYACNETDAGTGLLKHAVYHKPNNVGVDESCIWGDYFYLEALVRFEKVWGSYW
jgi:unsaturated chondroitin disaccharide hydrolase